MKSDYSETMKDYLQLWHNQPCICGESDCYICSPHHVYGPYDVEPEDDHERDYEVPEETPAGGVDRVPDHYRGDGMQPFDVIDAFKLDYYEGSVLKYLLRWRRKGGKTDLEKARHFLDELIARQTDGADDQAEEHTP